MRHISSWVDVEGIGWYIMLVDRAKVHFGGGQGQSELVHTNESALKQHVVESREMDRL